MPDDGVLIGIFRLFNLLLYVVKNAYKYLMSNNLIHVK